jgi:hypothetical protein
MLANANNSNSSAPNTKENEPLLYAPIFFNFQYYLGNDGDGTLTADMFN